MHTNGQDNSAITGINVTPLVDVILVLLIIFMAAAPMLQRRALHVNIPKAAKSERVAAEALRIEVDVRRNILFEGRKLLMPDLVRELGARAARDPALHVAVAADQALAYGDVVGLLDEIRSTGVRRVGLEVRRR